MKLFPLLMIVMSLLCTFSASAQRNNFLYIQTDNKQAFYVRANGKVHSSTRAGYLVIPQLADTTYTLHIGFPKNDQPEHSFQYEVHGKDQGFVLKNFGGSDWGLFNLQTLQVLKPVAEDDNADVADADQPAKDEIALNQSQKDVAGSDEAANQTSESDAGEDLQQNHDHAVQTNIKEQSAVLQQNKSASTDTVPPASTMIKGNTFIDRLALVVDDPSIKTKPTPAPSKAAPQRTAKADKITDAAAVSDATKTSNALNPSNAAITSNTTTAASKINDSNASAPTTTSAVARIQNEKTDTKHTASAARQDVSTSRLPSSQIAQKSMTELADGYMGIFVDEYSNGKKDTIRVYVSKALLKSTKGEVPAVPPSKETMQVDDTFGNVTTEADQMNHTDIDQANRVNQATNQENKATNLVQEKNDTVANEKPSVKNTITKPAKSNVTSPQPTHKQDVKFLDFEINKQDSIKATVAETRSPATSPDIEKEIAKPAADTIDSAAKSVLPDDSVASSQPEQPGNTVQIASDEQFKALRRMMTAEDSEDNMCIVAQKYFIDKQFSTNQIKLLASLFLKEGGLYKFLDASYPYVVDKTAFKELGSLLKDPYYINRFKALVSQQ